MTLPPFTPLSDLGPGKLGNGPFATYWVTWKGFQKEMSMERYVSGSNALCPAPLGLLYF